MNHIRVHPYVYLLTHKLTGEFYFGYRYANKVPAADDLGYLYFTSSSYIKQMGFEQFDRLIIAEFFNDYDAWLFEQQLIMENIADDKCLNRQYCKNGKKQFKSKNPGPKCGPISEEARARRLKTYEQKRQDGYISPKKGTIISLEIKEKISKALKGKKRTPEAIKACADGQRGQKRSEETRMKMKGKNGVYTRTLDHINALSESLKGNSNSRKTWQIEFENGDEPLTTDNLSRWCVDNDVNISSLKNTYKKKDRKTFHKGFHLLLL